MRANFPGLLIERHPSGSLRYRVRMAGDKTRRTAIPVGPDHPDFTAHYWAARKGETFAAPPLVRATPRSLQWLVDRYMTHLGAKTAAGQDSRGPRQRRHGQATPQPATTPMRPQGRHRGSLWRAGFGNAARRLCAGP